MEKKLSKANLGLRAKEVAEAMGNIPSWLTGWGWVIISFVFAASMLLIFSIRCSQVIGCRSVMAPEKVPDGASYTVQVSVAKINFDKLRDGQRVKIPSPGGNIAEVFVVEKQVRNDSCVLLLLFDRWAPREHAGEFQVIAEESAFERIFGLL